MPIQSQKGIDITPGSYQGVITQVYTETFQKTKTKDGHETKEDVVYLKGKVKTDDRETLLEVSWPASITPQTSLGRFLERMEMLPPVGEDFDEKSLENLRIKYTVKQDKQFVRIDSETVGPVS